MLMENLTPPSPHLPRGVAQMFVPYHWGGGGGLWGLKYW